ncbi:hypothetical protein AAG570_002044 [Ranatra chinensis]|uniref:Uncharacterized protein n=1 Tax=Ranatra chinensis TaxID=642074 RepID=A0ABD0YYI3_9HEMI
MASKRRNTFYKNKQDTKENGFEAKSLIGRSGGGGVERPQRSSGAGITVSPKDGIRTRNITSRDRHRSDPGTSHPPANADDGARPQPPPMMRQSSAARIRTGWKTVWLGSEVAVAPGKKLV